MNIERKEENNGDALRSMYRQSIEFQPGLPNDATLAERIMWEANPNDYAWRHQYLENVPHSLAIYLATRYANIFNQSGRRRANTFLRQFCENVLPRLKLVNEQYEFQHIVSGVMPFPFIESLEQLPTLGRKEIKQLAHEVARFMAESYDQYVEQALQNEQDAYRRLIHVYTRLAKLTQQAGTIAPYWQQFAKGRIKPTEDQLCAGLLRMMSDQWWYIRLKRIRDIRAEHIAIAVGQVQKAVSSYVSRQTLHEWIEQKRLNWEFLQSFDLENEDGERVSLSDKVLGSIANPAVRRCELMIRMRGFEDLANEMGCVGDFYTITAPSKYHSVHSGGGFVKNWNGATPKDTQKYLCKVWAKIRAAYSRAGISVFGFRVVEPHHDGTPHWHMLLFMRPEHVDEMRDIMCYYARLEDSEELQGQKALKARFHVKPIDKAKGSATGYIAKYISKNIDGYALDGEKDGETGQNLKDMSRSVSAWASRWRIRQFQQIGGAPVSVWRELRRLSGDEQILPDADMDNVRFAADIGNWFAYTEFQGGPLVARKDLTVRLSYEITEQGNAYGEDVQRILGVYSPRLGDSSAFITRTVKWNIVPKFSTASKGEGFDFSGTSWSSVNNCTEARNTVSQGSDLYLDEFYYGWHQMSEKEKIQRVHESAKLQSLEMSDVLARSLLEGGSMTIDGQRYCLSMFGHLHKVKKTHTETTKMIMSRLSEKLGVDISGIFRDPKGHYLTMLRKINQGPIEVT
ncbi:Bacteriophage replication gene A protein (GPA) [Photorhabdus australis subsp. thailandensis]|uniref:Bacteriophage replication gene A protein (GPA) n=1 Tax=Photorhabdus australis subsp. thailandensis TaxID=2805096 RepID=A0A1C0U332_9GAMM|nr:replication endonuclease [Photorhabdus australis]OCQ52337.1 Bacteriophage replication gene A protein (GPA) [Photorhabdus australis subsp. thailandensis]